MSIYDKQLNSSKVSAIQVAYIIAGCCLKKETTPLLVHNKILDISKHSKATHLHRMLSYSVLKNHSQPTMVGAE